MFVCSLCVDGHLWEKCTPSGEPIIVRSVRQIGPAWRVVARPFVIVFSNGTGQQYREHGSSVDTKSQVELLLLAVFLANQYHLTADVSPLVISETDWLTYPLEYRKSFNIILLARPSQSSLAQTLLSSIPPKLIHNVPGIVCFITLFCLLNGICCYLSRICTR